MHIISSIPFLFLHNDTNIIVIIEKATLTGIYSFKAEKHMLMEQKT